MGVPLVPRSNVDESRDMRPWYMLAEVKAVKPVVDTGTGKLECSECGVGLFGAISEKTSLAEFGDRVPVPTDAGK